MKIVDIDKSTVRPRLLLCGLIAEFGVAASTWHTTFSVGISINSINFQRKVILEKLAYELQTTTKILNRNEIKDRKQTTTNNSLCCSTKRIS